MPSEGNQVPSGGIIGWSGATTNIPMGWFLCDGTNGTPDLRNRMIIGAGDTYAVDATGGAATVTLTEGQLPAHAHGIQAKAGGAVGTSSMFTHSDTATNDQQGNTLQTGSGESISILPPYYALAYIMKS